MAWLPFLSRPIHSLAYPVPQASCPFLQLGSAFVEYLAAASYPCRSRFAMKQVDLLRFDDRSIRLVFLLLSHPALQATFARQYNAI